MIEVRHLTKTLCEAANALTTAGDGNLAGQLSNAEPHFRHFLATAKDLHGLAYGRGNMARALSEPSAHRSEAVKQAVVDFIRNELPLQTADVECAAGPTIRIQELARLRIPAKCLEHGRDCLCLFLFGAEANGLSQAEVDRFLSEVSNRSAKSKYTLLG